MSKQKLILPEEYAEAYDIPLDKVNKGIKEQYLRVITHGGRKYIVENALSKRYAVNKGDVSRLHRWTGKRGSPAFRLHKIIVNRLLLDGRYTYIAYCPDGRVVFFDTGSSEQNLIDAQNFCRANTQYLKRAPSDKHGLSVPLYLNTNECKLLLVALPDTNEYHNIANKLKDVLIKSLIKRGRVSCENETT